MALFQDHRPILLKGAMRDLWCHGFATYIDVCVQLAEKCTVHHVEGRAQSDL